MRSVEIRSNVLEMKCLRSLVCVSRSDRVMSKEVCRRAGIERELANRAHQKVSRWFGHVERIDEYRMARRELVADVSEGRVRGRPRLGWIDGLKIVLSSRRTTVEVARQSAKNKEWRALVHRMIEFNADIFAWPCVLSDRPPALWWSITWRGVECRYMIRLG